MSGLSRSRYRFIQAAISLFIIIKESHNITVLENEVIANKFCNDTLGFSVTYGSSIESCYIECSYRSKCRLIMFHRRLKQCTFLDSDFGDISFADSGPVCVYMKVSALERRDCTARKRFDISKGVCIFAECEPARDITNATVLSKTVEIGSTSRYRCNQGFYGVGTPRIECQANGNWTPTDFTCYNAYCPVPPHVENASSESDYTRVGSVIRYTCRTDFMLFGYPEISCQANATWSTASFQCRYAFCPNPVSIAGANLEDAKTFLGATNRYVCTNGHLGVGNPEIYCNINGLWIYLDFSCVKICSEPKPVDTGVIVAVEYAIEESHLTVGSSVTYECNEGFRGNGNSATIVCDTNGLWNPRNLLCCWNDTFSYGDLCYKAQSTVPLADIGEAFETCSSQGLTLTVTNQHLYEAYQQKGKPVSTWMLYNSRKSGLQSRLFDLCLSNGKNMSVAELADFADATYDNTRTLILENGWEKTNDIFTVNHCGRYIVNDWLPGQPNGQGQEDCIVSGPESAFKYLDINCTFMDNDIISTEEIGFSCLYKPPVV